MPQVLEFSLPEGSLTHSPIFKIQSMLLPGLVGNGVRKLLSVDTELQLCTTKRILGLHDAEGMLHKRKTLNDTELYT